ncbi:MAG: PilZ domain-containing protein [Oceanospirillaceae bacterium]|nr:PilZ domain-containing protein [Oceanospirillaceae bacterium]
MGVQERRRFFRIDDEVGLSVYELSGEGYGGKTIDDSEQQIEHQLALERKIRQALAALRPSSPQIAQALELLNQKINLLRHDSDTAGLSYALTKVNLSACGIAFNHEHEYPIGTQLMLNIFLQPQHSLIRVQGYVASVQRGDNADEPFYTRVDFVGLHNEHQEQLIQHLVQRQGQLLRQKMDAAK